MDRTIKYDAISIEIIVLFLFSLCQSSFGLADCVSAVYVCCRSFLFCFVYFDSRPQGSVHIHNLMWAERISVALNLAYLAAVASLTFCAANLRVYLESNGALNALCTTCVCCVQDNWDENGTRNEKKNVGKGQASFGLTANATRNGM